MSEKIKITKERNVRTYAEMWRTSHVFLQQGKIIHEGSYHQFMGSIVFTAFTLEAYLNHIGPQIFNCWESLEKLSPKDKINVIMDKIGLEVDYGKRPWQVIKNLFGFRNDIAHGKSTKVKEDVKLNTNSIDKNKIHEWVKTKWEKYCSEENATRARKDVTEIILKLHAFANIDEEVFQTGMQMSSVRVPSQNNK